MKIRYISDEEVTFDLDLVYVEVLRNAVLNWRVERLAHGTSEERKNLDDICRQMEALNVLVKAHTEGFPG